MLALLALPSAFTAPTASLFSRVQAPAVKMSGANGAEGVPFHLTKDHGPLVITLATTGNINTKERNPSLPCSPQEMWSDMHECIKLGVSVLHIHSRDEFNKPTMRVDVFRETCRLVKESDPDVILQISTGGRAGGGHE